MCRIRHRIVRPAGLPRRKQHFPEFSCLLVMARKKKQDGTEEDKRVEEGTVYDTRTPIWSKYYHEMRKRVKFPRYYKKSLNW